MQSQAENFEFLTTTSSFRNFLGGSRNGTGWILEWGDWADLNYTYWDTSVYLGCFAVTLCLTWYFFVKPYNLYRDFSDLGFEHVTSESRGNVEKRSIINEYRKRRRIGDLPPSYPNGWFAILETDELPVKTVKEVDVLGLNLVAWRGESGQCYVADAYCPHLGAHLGVGGKVLRECIECPFHGWVFDCSGKLTSIPYADSVPQFAKLKTWQIVEMYGLIFLWYHAENEDPSWFPDVISEVETNQWKYRGRTEFQVVCHIQEIPENGADVAHLGVVHSSLALAGSIPEEAKFGWEFLKHAWSASWKMNDDPRRQHEALLKVDHSLTLLGISSFARICVDVHQVGPGIVLMQFNTVVGKGVLIQTVTPVEPLRQRIVHRFYSSPTFIHPLACLILHLEGIQISRDIRIWNRKTFINKPILTKEDHLIKQFRRWYSQFYSENSPKFTLTSRDGHIKLDF